MSVLGSVAIEVSLDMSGIDKQLKSLESKKLKPIKQGLSLDVTGLQKELKQLHTKIDPIKVDLSPNVEDFQEKLRRVGKLSSVKVDLTADIEGLGKKVKGLRIDPIKVDLSPNVGDFQEKLRRVARISPVTAEIQVDAAKVRNDFQELGRYAAEGFRQGFGDGGDIGKSISDSIVGSVKRGLGIQSPSRVFGEIGKYAKQGFVGGLKNGINSELGDVVKQIESEFKKIKLSANAQINSSLSGSTGSDKSIISSIESGFKKVKGGGLFSSLGSMISAPLTGVVRGAFEGVGTPVGRQVGTGVTKALQSVLGKEIGSLELLSQKAVEKSLQGIPAAQNAIVEVIKSNPIGNIVVQQLEQLSSILERYGVELSPQKAIQAVTTAEERAVASSAASFEGQQGEFKSRKKAKAGAIADFVSITEQRGNVEQLSKALSQAESDATKTLKKVVTLQAKIAAGKGTKEDVQNLSKASASLEASGKEIENLRQIKKDYEEKLRNQIKVLASLGVESELTAEAVKSLDLTATLENLLASQKAIQDARKNVQVKAKTPEAIRDKKLEKLQANAQQAQSNLQAELSKPNASVENIQKLQKRVQATSKALDLYRIEITDPAKDIEQTTKRIDIVNKNLSSVLQKLEENLSQGLVSAIESATREIVNVGNLNQIPQPKRTLGQQVIEQKAIREEQERRKAAQLEQVKQLKTQQAASLPKLYTDAVQSVSRIVTGKELSPEIIPNLVPSSDVAGKGSYAASTNTYSIKPEFYDQIATGDINQVADEVIQNIVHEIFHAFQHGFGRAIADKTGKPAVDITPTKEEMMRLGEGIEASASAQREERRPLSRQLETGAYVFADRNSQKVKEELRRKQLQEQALSLGGVGGNKIKYDDTNKAIAELRPIIQKLQDKGIDTTKIKTDINKAIEEIRRQASEVGNSIADVTNLGTDELEKAVQQYQQILSSIGQLKKSTLKTAVQSLQSVSTVDNLRSRETSLVESRKQAFSGSPKDRKIKDRQKAEQYLQQTEQLIFAADDALKSGNLAPDQAKQVGALKGRMEKRYRDFSPAIRKQQSEELNKLAQQSKSQTVSVGANFNQGFVDGLNDSRNKVVQTVQEIFQQSLDTAENTLEIQSPSKKTKKIGIFYGQGFEIGATESLGAASKTIARLHAKQIAEHNAEIKRQNRKKTSETERANLNIQPKTREKSLAELNAEAEANAVRFRRYEKSSRTASQVIAERNEQTRIKSALDSESAKVEDLFASLALAIEQLEKEISVAAKRFERIEENAARVDTALDIAADAIESDTKITQSTEAAFDNNEIRKERDRIQNQAKISANLERKYGLEGTAPEVLPELIPEIANRSQPSKQGGFKGMVASFKKQVVEAMRKRASAMVLEIDSAIAPGLEAQASVFKGSGDSVKQKQYERLAKQARTATKGIETLISKPGELSEKESKRLQRLTSQLEEVYQKIGRPLPSGKGEGSGFLNDFGLQITNITQKLGTFIKGALAFGATSFLQTYFRNLAQDAFKAYVELDKMKTVLNFASGSSIAGNQNLAFVKQLANDLKIPLNASITGYTKLEAAARGSVLAGKQTRELFKGLSQASTVLSLSGEETEGISVALAQMTSKKKVFAEEMNQLAERIPGIFGIMSRAAGVTEAEFTRLRDSGQILTEDFFPKFAQQLQSEFGDAALDASGNAQSAIFDLQNSVLSFQQGVGEGLAPAAVGGINALSVGMKGLSAISKELGFAVLAVTVTLSVKMGVALKEVIANLIATKLATGTLGGGIASLASTINNSFSAKLAVGIFAVLEVVNLLNQAINTELIKSFDKAAKSADRAAREAEKALDPTTKAGERGTEPESSNWVGRAADSVIRFGNLIPGEWDNASTWGEYEQTLINNNTARAIGRSSDLMSGGRKNLSEMRRGELPQLEKQLQQAEQQRQITQANIRRNFTEKGLVVPAEAREELAEANKLITDLNSKREELSKPITLNIARTDRQIASLRAQIEALDTEEGIAAVGGDEAAQKLKDSLNESVKALQNFKAESEKALGELKLSPILQFEQALRKLNLALAESQEINQLRFNNSRAVIGQQQLAGFSSNKFASKDAAIESAKNDLSKNRADVEALRAATDAGNRTVSEPGFQATLQKLGVSPDSSVAKISDVLQFTQDEADKAVLEKLRGVAETRLRLSESQSSLSEIPLRLRQAEQDKALFTLDERSNDDKARISRNQNESLTFYRRGQAKRSISGEEAGEANARIELENTQALKDELDTRLSSLRNYHSQGIVSAEEYERRRRDLLTEYTALEKQEAENQLALADAIKSRKIADLEFFNRQAEGVLAIERSNATTAAKERLLTMGLTQSAQDEFNQAEIAADRQVTEGKIANIRKQLYEYQNMYGAGDISLREFKDKQVQFNQELAGLNTQLIDQKIKEEENYRQTVERNIQRQMQLEDAQFRALNSQLSELKNAQELYTASLDRTLKLEESRFNLDKALGDADISPLELQRDKANRSLELARRLNDQDLDPRIRGEIQGQLSVAGFGNSELSILDQRSKIESEIAAKKLQSLQREQEYQRRALEIDLQRQQIAAEMAIYDAQGLQLAAQKATIEAEGALRVAKIKKDDLAAQSAQIGLEIAKKEAEIADKKLKNSQENLSIQKELSDNAKKAQDHTQKSAVTQLEAAEAARKQAASLERVESSVRKTASQMGKLGGEDIGVQPSQSNSQSSQQRSETDGVDFNGERLNKNPLQRWTKKEHDEWKKNRRKRFSLSGGEKMESDFEMKSRIFDMKMDGQIVELPRRTVSSVDTSGFNRDTLNTSYQDYSRRENQSPANPVAVNNNAPAIGIEDGLKNSVNKIEGRLADLAGNINSIASRPSTLQVSSPAPVQDAAKIYSDMSKNAVKSAGL